MNKIDSTPCILIADDEERMRRIIVDYLSIKGFNVVEACDGEEAVRKFRECSPDLVLLDVMMPKMDGWQVCAAIHNAGNTPVIMLTARDREEDELRGFELGADEYITKPFSLKVLFARIEAVFRRTGQIPSAAESRTIPGITIDRDRREIRVNNVPTELTYTEFELLSYLQDNSGLALSRDKILDSVWRYDYFGDARTVDTHIKKLRAKLGECGDCIKTIRGIGYKLEI